MKYYVISGIDKLGQRKYMGYDQEDDRYYWTLTNMEMAVTRFPDAASAEQFSLTRKEFTTVMNTGEELLMPELLFNMEIPTIEIQEVVYFEQVKVLDFSVAMTEYKTRKTAFDIKAKELESI